MPNDETRAAREVDDAASKMFNRASTNPRAWQYREVAIAQTVELNRAKEIIARLLKFDMPVEDDEWDENNRARADAVAFLKGEKNDGRT